MTQATFDRLFDPVFLRRLEGLTLRVRDGQKGGRLAEQRTRARGQGAEFADFKPYAAGDDLRAVDWNVYRRLGRVFVRVFEERQDLPVQVMIDVSRSMFVEEPPRIDAARQVAMGIAAVALRQHDSVSLLSFSDAVSVSVRGATGKASLMRIAHALAALEPAGGTALADALGRAAALGRRRGLLVLVSDFFDEAGLDRVFAALARLQHRIMLVQIVKPSDADPRLLPALAGDIVLDDGERTDGMPLTVTPELVALYQDAYRDFSGRIVEFARKYGAGLARIDADRPVLEQLGALFDGGSLTL